jgi:hypothetical protein
LEPAGSELVSLPPEPSEDAEFRDKLKHHIWLRVARYFVTRTNSGMPKDRNGAEKHVRMYKFMGARPESYPEFEEILKEVLDDHTDLIP